MNDVLNTLFRSLGEGFEKEFKKQEAKEIERREYAEAQAVTEEEQDEMSSDYLNY